MRWREGGNIKRRMARFPCRHTQPGTCQFPAALRLPQTCNQLLLGACARAPTSGAGHRTPCATGTRTQCTVTCTVPATPQPPIAVPCAVCPARPLLHREQPCGWGVSRGVPLFEDLPNPKPACRGILGRHETLASPCVPEGAQPVGVNPGGPAAGARPQVNRWTVPSASGGRGDARPSMHVAQPVTTACKAA